MTKVSARTVFFAVGALPQSFKKALHTAFQLRCGICVFATYWMGSGWTISRLGPGCSGRTDGVWVDDIVVGTWMLWQNGWDLGGRYHGGTWMLWQNGCGLGGRYHGWDLDALAERMGSGWTISWLGPGCSGRTDGVWVDDIMVGTWMLWQNGCGLGGRYHGWDLDALAERMGFGWTIS